MSDTPYYEQVVTNMVETWSDVGLLLLPAFSILGAFLVVGAIGHKALGGEKLPTGSIALVVAFGLVGLAPGLVAGYSREPITGTFLTATIGIVSATISYAFNKPEAASYQKLVPFLLIAMLLGAITGYGAGEVPKKKWLEYDQQVQTREQTIKMVHAPIQLEREQENLKRYIAANPNGYITAAQLVQANRGEEPSLNNGAVELGAPPSATEKADQ